MAGRIQGCDLDVVPALMGRLGSPCGTPDTSAIVISTKRSAWRDLRRFLDYARNDREEEEMSRLTLDMTGGRST